MPSIVIKKQTNISKKRKPFSPKTLQSYIPLSVNEKKVENMLFHKFLQGYILILLNKYNEPVKAWSNVDSLMMIKCKLIKNVEHFKTIYDSIKPKILYLTDGTLLQPLIAEQKIELYENLSLTDVLNNIKIERNEKKQYTIPTYKEILELDPTITKKEYQKTYMKKY